MVSHMAGHIGAVGATRHHQGRACFDQHARWNIVHRAQIGFTQTYALGGFGHRDCGGDSPDGPARVLPIFMGLQIAAEHLGVVPRQQNLRCGGSKHYGLVKARVQRLEVLCADISQLGNQFHVHVTLDGHGLKVGVIFNCRQLGVEGIGLGHNVLQRLQLGHVHARLGRHLQVQITSRQIQLLVALDGPAHTAFTPVVSGQCQVPVTKHAVELLQVIKRGAGGRQHIAPVIAEHVLLEVEVGAGGGHELPHAGGLGAGDRQRVEGAFDKGQQSQLGRHVAPLQLFNNVKQVFVGALCHAQQVVRPGCIPLLTVRHGVVHQVRHGEALAHARP